MAQARLAAGIVGAIDTALHLAVWNDPSRQGLNMKATYCGLTSAYWLSDKPCKIAHKFSQPLNPHQVGSVSRVLACPAGTRRIVIGRRLTDRTGHQAHLEGGSVVISLSEGYSICVAGSMFYARPAGVHVREHRQRSSSHVLPAKPHIPHPLKDGLELV